MSKPETTFTAGVHKYLPPGRDKPYWMKNNNLYTSGIWDVWYSGDAADLWVEYKFIVLPKRDTTMIEPDLSALQIDWGRKRHDEGRNMAVIVGCKEGGVILRERDWENPISTADFKLDLLSRKELAEWIVGYTQKGTIA